MKQVVTNDLYNIFLYLFLHVNKQAVDGGKPALSATVAVHIIVTDTNDHAPSFPQLNYEYNITTTEPQVKVCFHKDILKLEPRNWNYLSVSHVFKPIA